MRRRELLGALAGAAAWPVVARAQESTTLVDGFLRSTSFSSFENLVSALQIGLYEAGFVDGAERYDSDRDGDDQSIGDRC